MGFSYTAAAGCTMGGIELACAASRPEDDKSSNVFYANGRRYFDQIVRRDQKDGGLIGTIHVCWEEAGKEWAREVGTFKVDGKGRVLRGPKLFKQAVPVRVGEGRWG